MKVAVIGAGIVGITTAWELRADGHEVEVLERRNSVAEEASFANAGVVAPGYVTPWAAPGMPRKVLSQIWSQHSAVRFGPRVVTSLPWLWRFLRSCQAATHEANRAAMRQLALHSLSRLRALAGELEIPFEQSEGYLVLARTQADWLRLSAGAQSLRELGIQAEAVDAHGCRKAEPGLRAVTPLVGGVRLGADLVGNCRAFAQALKARAVDSGVAFRFGCEVLKIQPGSPAQVHWRSASGGDRPPSGTNVQTLVAAFDAVVVCAGAPSRALLQTMGLRLPLLSVFGYSMTAPLRSDGPALLDAPRSGIMDERFKVAITRLGQHVRVAGSAEIGGHPARMNEAAQKTLYKVLEDWFPGVCDLSRARHWKGARPMTPDGPPLIGPAGPPGVWLNVGHGSSGWALSCGSARLLCDLLGGRATAMPNERLLPQRLQRMPAAA